MKTLSIIVLALLLAVPVMARAEIYIEWNEPQHVVPFSELRTYCLVGDEWKMISTDPYTGRVEVPARSLLPAYGSYQCYLQLVDVMGEPSVPTAQFTIHWCPVQAPAPVLLGVTPGGCS